ncbi:MAG: hypothetical protein IKX21_04555 [Deltaproteobacteria bacterium]|nr:hypothetical protein [Deltaproteobacteria bacterium]
MYNWITEIEYSVTVSYVVKPRTVRIGDFDGDRTGSRRYSFSTVSDAESFLRACGYSREAGHMESLMNASLGGRPATEKIKTWIWSSGTRPSAHLDERTVTPVEKRMEAVRVRVQFYNYPVYSYTVKELGSDKEVDVYTDSCGAAVGEFLGRYYPDHELILADKTSGDTFTLHLKKPV